MSDDSLEHRITQGPMRSAPEGDEGRRLYKIEQLLEKLIKIVGGDGLDPNAPPGLRQRQDIQEEHLSSLEKRVLDLEDEVPARQGRLIEWENFKADVREIKSSREADRSKNEDRTSNRITQAIAFAATTLIAILATIYSLVKAGSH